jgi:hypothetical protein
MAITFAIAYLLCVLAPPVALAFVGGSSAFHCLTTQHQRGAAHVHDVKAFPVVAHAHGADAGHEHTSGHRHDSEQAPIQSDADDRAVIVNCCGLFCVSSMPAGVAPDIVPMARVLPVQASVDRGVAGCGPDSIYRPPIVLLPM